MIKVNPIKINLKLKLKKALSNILKFPKNRKGSNLKKIETQDRSENFENWFPHESF